MSWIQILGIAMRALPALVWAVACVQSTRFLLAYRPRATLYWLFPLLAGVVTLTFVAGMALWLFPEVYAARGEPLHAGLLVLNDVTIVTGLALFRHVCWYLPNRDEAPGRRWLALNYGSAAAMVALSVFFDDVLPAATFERRVAIYRFLYLSYELAMLTLCLRVIVGIARRGAWTPGGGMIVLRHADVALIAASSLGAVGALALIALGGNELILWLLVDTVMGLAVTIPILARFLGDVVRTGILALLAASVALAVHLGLRLVLDGTPGLGPGTAGRTAIQVCASAVLVLAALLAQPSIRAAIDRVVFRRSRERWLELQAFAHELSPELGRSECCRRALAEVMRVEKLPGAAILLDDGRTLRHGRIELGRVLEAWPPPADAGMPRGQMLGDYAMYTLPRQLRDALVETDVVTIVPVVSPRRRHGHLLLSAGLLGAHFPREDVEAIHSFADQLALVLDAADLLARAVAVERSLAQTEKLAAIGELAARIAHEIRNPVTAARSLAQLLSREPTSPHNAEHAELILAELERVERQVRALLRFARMEEYEFSTVDLGDLVRRTLAELQPKLATAGVGCELTGPPGVVTRADREKLRQVLVNLVENAIDALGEVPAPRTVSLAVGRANGCSTLDVADNGPGLDAATLERIFEPFFSSKAHGTGLGLAIVKRIVEAHGGRIAATAGEARGMRFHLELPAGEARAGGPG